MSVKNFIYFFFGLLLIWLFVFFVDRVITLGYFFEKLPSPSISSILELFLNAFRLDLSTASYLIAFPLLLLTLLSFFNKQDYLPKVLHFYQPIFIFLYLLVGWSNLNLYREWGVKLNFKALMILFQFPYEVAISGITSSLLIPTLLYLFALFIVIKFNKRMLSKIRYDRYDGNFVLKSVLGILMLGINFLCIRGGWQLTPINLSMAQYSNMPIYNHLSSNTLWGFTQNTLFELQPAKSAFNYFSKPQVDSILSHSNELDSSIKIFKPTVKNPNVVLVILESFTADVIESMGGEKGVTPNIESIIKEGILFTNVYASGERTDKGVVAILSSFPAQATKSIIKENEKQGKLPSLSQQFKKHNYQTSFYYGGESEFFGLKSFLLSHAYDQIIDKNNFEQKDFNSKWGAHDGVLFKKHIEDMKLSKAPFFSTILTLSNHEPFETPIAPKYKGSSMADKFRNTAYYTDLSIGEYFKQVKQQEWFSNTLFILVADHGHRLPRNTFEIWDPRRYRIPMILYGDVLQDEYKGYKAVTYGSQTDLSTTLYSQLNFNFEKSIWSKNLLPLNGRDGYAFFNWDNGFGLVGKNFSLSYSEDVKKIIRFDTSIPNIDKESKLDFAKAYMQKVFSDYLSF
ncbi:MAG: hypothetical protein RL000_819 [Bacteroidota bacterium]